MRSTRGDYIVHVVVALSELLGATVRDASGAVRGRVREIAIAPQDHPTRIAFLIVKTPTASACSPPDAIKSCRRDGARRHRSGRSGSASPRPTACCCSSATCSISRSSTSTAARSSASTTSSSTRRRSTAICSLNVVAVDVGARGAVRRLSKGHRAVVHAARAARADSAAGHPVAVRRSARDRPGAARQAEDRLQGPVAAASGRHRRHRRGPARRPSAKRCSKRSTRRSPPRRSRRSIPTSRCRSSSRSTRIAPPTSSRRWIPTPPPTCSASSPEEHSDEILQEMQPEERHEVTQLLEFSEHTAAGRMTTEFIAVAGNRGRRRCDRGAEAVRRQPRGGGDDLPDRRRRTSWSAPCRW